MILSQRTRIGLAMIIFSLAFLSAFFIGIFYGKAGVECEYHPWMKMYSGQEKQISDRILPDNIQVFRDRVIIMGDFYWTEYENTNSMLPLLDIGSNGLYYPVYENTDLVIGDVVSYRPTGYDEQYVHRIIDIKEDEDGPYFILKGDNNKLPDPFKVRKNEIKGVMVGILW